MALPPDDLERFRPYLALLVRMQLGRRYEGKVDESGVVQETMKDAWRTQVEFQAWTEVQQLAWLKLILKRNTIDAIRKVRGCDVPLPEDGDGSSAPAAEGLMAGGASPSEQATKNEQWLRVAEALPELPKDQRTAIYLHYFDKLKLDEIATQMNRTKVEVAQLIQRGIKGLRKRLNGEEGESR